MKHSKLITWLSAAVLGISAAVACSAGMAAKAATGTQTVNGINYSYDTATHKAKVTGCTNDLAAANIVSSFRVDGTTETVTVTEINTGAFKYKSKIASVSIPSSITVIGSDAFWGTSITSVSIPNGVTVINENTFRKTKLTSVSIPNTVTSIGDRAFLESPLVAVTIPNSVRTIGYYAFGMTTLQTVTVPATVENLVHGAFFYCQSLTSATIRGATKIGGSTFQGCTALRNVSLSSAVPEIGSEAFSGCSVLQTVTIPGATQLQGHAFENCTSLSSVWLSNSSWTSTSWSDSYAFYNCPALYTVNGVQALQYQTDANGVRKPIINPAIKTAIRNHFCRSLHVGFVDSYCSDLCKYIVKTETSYDPDGPENQPNDWMNDALKARQLHDWLLRHCKREDGLDPNGQNTESNGDIDNQIATSVFLSYATDNRGTGIGESICAGLSKAFTMLLATAKIESHFIRDSNHAWNLVKIGDQYYHADILCDVNRYSYTTPNLYKTCYNNFLTKTRSSNSTITQKILDEHPLLTVYQNDISGEIYNCTEDYSDYNGDGILEFDFDLDGTAFGIDQNDDQNAYNGMLYFVFGSELNMFQINDRLSEVLYWLHHYGKSFWVFVNDSGPKDQTVPVGTNAKFKVTLFGDDLTYQWQYYNTSTGTWVNAPFSGAQRDEMTVPATDARNGMQFGCIAYNKNGYAVYSDIAVLRVTPRITAQPQTTAAQVGDLAQFTVTAAGTGLSYQWQYYNRSTGQWTNSTSSGAQSATVRVTATEARNGEKYRCIVTNSHGNSVISEARAMWVTAKITAQPQDVTASVGDAAIFTVTATGTGLRYQWQYYKESTGQWVDATFSGSASKRMYVTATTARDNMKFRCLITNSHGIGMYSSTATLHVV